MLWPSASSNLLPTLTQYLVEKRFNEDGAGGGAVLAAIRFYRFDEPHASSPETINMRHSNIKV